MEYDLFQEICAALYITRTAVAEEYESNIGNPWSVDYDSLERERERDAGTLLDFLFENNEEINLEQITGRIKGYKEKLKKVRGPVWGTIGNTSVAISQVAATKFEEYLALLPEQDFNLEDLEKIREQGREKITQQGKRPPYGNMDFPNFVEKPEGGFTTEGTHPADHEAAAMMYRGNLLALLIAREYDFEQYLP